jgi:signal peptidase II
LPLAPGGPDAAERPRRRQFGWLFALASLVVVVDQLSKLWAVSALSGPGQTISLLDSWLELRLVRNAGAAFSMGESFTWVFTVLSAVVVVAVVATVGRVRSIAWALILGLLLGGATGNLADRLFRPPGPGRGHVVDFIDYAGRFVGNVADIAIVLAMVAMVTAVLRGVPLDGTKKCQNLYGGAGFGGRAS